MEVHLQVDEGAWSDGILTKKGNPIPGHFEKSYSNVCFTEHTFTYDLALEEFEPIDDLSIAAHAALGREETTTIFSDGDSKTLVTAGNVPAAIYPYLAVDAWEAFGDPPDSTPSTWDSMLTRSFNLADWIWEAYRVVDPQVIQDITLEQAFTVPGFPNGGKLYIATDNTYSVSLNGDLIGEHTDWNTWYVVGEFDIYPTQGTNILSVIGSNYGDPSYNLDNNPAGVIFEALINYYTDGETAWGKGTRFNEDKNWATYFTYTVQGLKVDLVPCPFNYPDGRDGTGFVIFNEVTGSNNLEMTVHLEGAPALPTTYDVYLFVDGGWYGGAPVGDMTIDGAGNADFNISVSVTPLMGHWLAVDLTAQGSTADIYETPDIHTPGHQSVYMEF